jgi:2,3-bisphosphoglycerate-dependent phosphoglycerate mutase
VDLIIVRHGRPLRIEGAAGAADPPLTDIGHEQAAATARLLLREQIDHVVTSPMQRARQTAQPLADALGIDAEIVQDLAEIDKDANEYIPMEELKAQGGAAWQAVIDDPHSINNGVDLEEFADTVTAAFEKIIADNPRRTVVAFCHGMVTMQFLRRVLGYENPWGLRTDYASITRLQASSTGIRTVRSVNETSHLGDSRILSP